MTLASHSKKGLIEKELKYGLTKKDYQKLMRACRKKVRFQAEHLNCYFDDPKLRLRKKRYGLRIRIVDGTKAFITLKHPARTGKKTIRSLKVRREYEEAVSFKMAKAVIRGEKPLTDLRSLPVRVLREAFSGEALQRLRPLGTIKTLRTVVAANGGSMELEIDKFKLFGQSYYELEVETVRPKRADQIVRWLFRENNIPYHPITKSKLGRFIPEWKKTQ